MLLQAIKQSFHGLVEIITRKNKELLSLRTENPKQLSLVERNVKLLLEQISLYLQEHNRYYQDPNFKVFQAQLHRIQDSYEFRNIDVRKFMPKKVCLSTAVQTD